MPAHCDIIAIEEKDQIITGLKKIKEKVAAGEVEYTVANEDIHMNLEQLLIEEIGPVGGKLHTGRSRNDQVATDFHLYVKKQTEKMIELLTNVQKALVTQAQNNLDTIMPEYTHLQRAQPIIFAHHLLAYFWMFERDKQRFQDSLQRVNWSPLGA